MRISELEGRSVALWGFGREGRAAWVALRRRFPAQPLTAFVKAEERDALQILDDAALTIETTVDAARLRAFDCVIKSPGISPYVEPALSALAQGAQITSGTALWFNEALPGLKLCVTGSKGKSTTTALIAHLLRARGLRIALAGNIGLPLMELLEPGLMPAAWVIELSSYQTASAREPDVAVLLNLYPEHLDWHGSLKRYYADKLSLIHRARPRRLVLNALDPRLCEIECAGTPITWFGDARGWHWRGNSLFRADVDHGESADLPLPGAHNRLNLCAALAAIEALGFDAAALIRHAASFRPLPHRLQTLGSLDGIRYVNDSISTTPHATLAALDCFAEHRVALIVGGYDRGLPWEVFVERCRAHPPAAVFTRGQNGPRIHIALAALPSAATFILAECATLEAAVAAGRAALGNDGVLLLSPGAPSFPEFVDYTERGRAFASACGFDPALISSIPGLGIA